MGVICDSDRLLAIELHYYITYDTRLVCTYEETSTGPSQAKPTAIAIFNFSWNRLIVFGQEQEPNQQTLVFIGAGWLPVVVVHVGESVYVHIHMYMYICSSFLIERGAGTEVRPSPKQMSTDLPYYL
jgi:hypothetical protein